MAGYQLLVFKMLYIYVMLICDTLINYYLLTYYKCSMSHDQNGCQSYKKQKPLKSSSPESKGLRS